MAIISVAEDFGARSSTVDQMYARTYTRAWNVVTSDPFIGPIAVRGAVPVGIGTRYENGVPSADPRHEYDNGAFVQSVACEEKSDGAGIDWKVTATYGPWNPAELGGGTGDPTQWKIQCTFGGERAEKVVTFDRYGNPITNSVGDRFGDPVTVDDHITTLLITRNELVSSFDPQLASQMGDTINDDVWNTIPKGWCRMGIITTSEEKYDSVGLQWYYTVTYPVQLGRKPWKKELLDQGYNALQAGAALEDERPMSMKGKDGQPYGEPRLLDGTGHELPPGGTPVTLTYEVFDETDWSILNIDMSLRLGL